MKLSIQSVFKNLTLFITSMVILLLILSLISVQRYTTFLKLDRLDKIQTSVNKLQALQKDELAYANIQLTGSLNSINDRINSLKSLEGYDYAAKIFGNENSYSDNLQKFQKFQENYSKALHAYLQPSDENLPERILHVRVARTQSIEQLHLMKDEIMHNSYLIFSKLQWLIYLTLILTLFGLFRFKKRLKLIYKDIEFLYGVNTNNNRVHLNTQEAEVIRNKLARKPVISDNPAMIDPVTEIKNYKGMLHAYANKKGVKENNFTIVCLFDIDNFQSYRTLPKEFLNSTLKKIAFMMSLYEQATDVIARVDYSKFAVILSRDTKSKALQECQAILESVCEVNFKPSKEQDIKLTLSGGFVIKPRNQTLEETLKNAEELLATAKKQGGNVIIQIQDHAQQF